MKFGKKSAMLPKKNMTATLYTMKKNKIKSYNGKISTKKSVYKNQFSL